MPSLSRCDCLSRLFAKQALDYRRCLAQQYSHSRTLVVTLTSSDTTEASVPNLATIPAFQTSVVITVSAVDDTLLDGTQIVQVSASAAGYASSTGRHRGKPMLNR